MDNEQAVRLTDSNNRLIEAMGMHWTNEARKAGGEAPAFGYNDFIEVANRDPYA